MGSVWTGFCDEWISRPLQSFGICLAFAYTLFIIIYSIIKNIYKYYIKKMDQPKEEIKYPSVPDIEIEDGQPKFNIKQLPSLEIPEILEFSKPTHMKQFHDTQQKYVNEYALKQNEINKINKINNKKMNIQKKMNLAIADGKDRVKVHKNELTKEIKRELRSKGCVVKRDIQTEDKTKCGTGCFSKKNVDNNIRIIKFCMETGKDIYDGVKNVWS